MTLLQYLLMPTERQKETTLLLEVVKPLPFFYRGFWRWKKKHGIEHITDLTWGEVREIIDLMSSAGAEQLQPFNDLATIDTMAQGDVLRYEQIEALPYNVVFYSLYYKTIKQNIENRFQQIITKR